MRKSTKLFLALAVQLVIGLLLWAHATLSAFEARHRLAAEAALVDRLMLTDLALFTEARYTRHLSQADLQTPFQDFPMAFEHFPSGSFVQPASSHFQHFP